MNENKIIGHGLITVEPNLESLSAAVQQLYSLYQQEHEIRQELELKVATLKKRVEDVEADNEDLYNTFLTLKKKVAVLSRPTPASTDTTPFSPFASKSAFANAPMQSPSRVETPSEKAVSEPTAHTEPENSAPLEALPGPVPASIEASAPRPSTGRFFSVGAAGQRMLQNALQACVKQVVTRSVAVAQNAHDQVRAADRPGRLFYSRTRLLQLRPSRVDTYACQQRLPRIPGIYADLAAGDTGRLDTRHLGGLGGGAPTVTTAAQPRAHAHPAQPARAHPSAAPHTDKHRGRGSARPASSYASYAEKLAARYGVLHGMGDRPDTVRGARGRGTGPKREPAPLVDVEGRAIAREELSKPLQRAAERWVPRALRSQVSRAPAPAPTATAAPATPATPAPTPEASTLAAEDVPVSAMKAVGAPTTFTTRTTEASTDAAAEAEAAVQAVLATVRSKLNKLTETTLPKFTMEIAQLLARLPTQAAVAAVASLVYLKSIQDPAFCPLYAALCAGIHAQLQLVLLGPPPAPAPGASGVGAPTADTFRRELVSACQAAFAQLLAQHAASASAPAPAQVTPVTPQQARGLGRLIGELYKVRLLRIQAVLAVLAQELDLAEAALRAVPPRVREDDLEALLQLLRSVGAAVDADTGITPELSSVVESVYARLRALTHSDSGLTTRMRFLVLDLVELRARAWRPTGTRGLN